MTLKASQPSEIAKLSLQRLKKTSKWYYHRHSKRSEYFDTRDAAIKAAFRNGFGTVIDEKGNKLKSNI